MSVFLSAVAVLLAFGCFATLMISEYRDYRQQFVQARIKQPGSGQTSRRR